MAEEITERYRVHGAHVVQVSETVTLKDGSEVSAPVPYIEVELVTEDPRHGSIKLRYGGKKHKGAADLFGHGGEVDVTFSRVSGK